MSGTARSAAGFLVALLLPACNLTYVPDQSLDPGGGSGAPTGLFLPLDGDLQVVTNPQFGWYAIPGATTYRLQVSTAADFSGIVWDDSSLTVTTTILSAVTLTNFTNYYWRIYGIIPGSTPVLADGSPFQFRTDGGGTTIPLSFSNTYPSNGLMGVSVSPQFSWTPSIGATSYTLQVDPNGFFSPPQFSEANIQVNRATLPGALSISTGYAWRVIAIGQSVNTTTLATDFTTTGP
jgi:hypothetical protein